MNFLIIKPNGKYKIGEREKQIETFPVKKVVSPEDFISQYVGTQATMVEVGDYRMYVNRIEDYIDVGVGDKVYNLFLNEFTFTIGNVLVVSNNKLSTDEFAGVDDMDLAIIINAFKSTTQLVVDDENAGEVTVDRIYDSLLTKRANDNANTLYDGNETQIMQPENETEGIIKENIDVNEEFIFNIDDISSPAEDGDSVVMTKEEVEAAEQEYLKSL